MAQIGGFYNFCQLTLGTVVKYFYKKQMWWNILKEHSNEHIDDLQHISKLDYEVPSKVAEKSKESSSGSSLSSSSESSSDNEGGETDEEEKSPAKDNTQIDEQSEIMKQFKVQFIK